MADLQKYIKNNLVGEIQKLQDSGFHYISFIIITQAIEILGSLLDSKPIRARRQSRQRFSMAIETLFSREYRRLNRNDWMYDKLRNHLTHSFIPSSWIILRSRNNSDGRKHLEFVNGKTVFISEDYFKDFCKSCDKVISMIDKGQLKEKKLPPELLLHHF